MKITASALLAVLLLSGVASGSGEGSLLERLDEECRALAARADAATAEIRVPGPRGWASLPDPRDPQNLEVARRWLLYLDEGRTIRAGERVATAVLVGTPPVLVTSAHAVGSAREVEFRLADGTTGRAALRARDPDLGLAVFALPEEVAAGREGLTPSPRAERGRIAIVAGGGDADASRPLRLALVRGTDVLRGWIRVDGLDGSPAPGTPALGADGRLLGVAASFWGEAGGGDASSQFYRFVPQQRQPPEPPAPSLRFDERGRLEIGLLDKSRWADRSLVTFYPGTGAARRLPPGSFVSGSVIARVLEDLAEHGRIRHAYLGVVLGQIRGKGESRGVEIRAVLDGSPASEAGIAARARVRSVNGLPLDGPEVLGRALALARPGDVLALGLVGSEGEVRVVLGDRAEAERGLVSPSDIGLVCVDLGSDLARFLDLPEGTRGVVVREVVPESPAAQAGLARGQVIVAGAGEPVADVAELEAAVAGAKGKIELEVVTGEGTRKVQVRIPSSRIGSRAR